MDPCIPNGMFNFSIEKVTRSFSYRVYTDDVYLFSAKVKGRLFGLFPKNIIIFDDQAGDVLSRIQIDNFFGTRATIKMDNANSDRENLIGLIKVPMKGFLIYSGNVITVNSKDKRTTINIKSPTASQQVKGAVPMLPMAFPVEINNMYCGALEVVREITGTHSCSFKISHDNIVRSGEDFSGFMVIAGALILIRKMISTSM